MTRKMIKDQQYKVETFGRDCWGNISGYQVVRRGYNQFPNGEYYFDTDTAGKFVANLYEDGSFGRAKQDAVDLMNEKNSELGLVE